jgi:cytochrome c553
MEFFEKRIRPILATNCAACHNAKGPTAGLDLSTTEGIRYAVQYGAEAGKLVSPDKPEESLLIQVIEYAGRLKMPPNGKLKDEQLDDMRAWVQAGTPVPGANLSAKIRPGSAAPPLGQPVNSTLPAARTKREFTEAEKNFWAFQKFSPAAPPPVKDAAWVKSPIDRFILAKLEAQDLKPVAPAGKATLLRRVTFDLTGLPPTEAEIGEFMADASPNAYEKVVDRLLASPRYGEQWGRHWLDVARYADSTGNDEDHRYPYAYQYRDYVIDSFNKNVAFDRFVREQIAGDLLPADQPGAINRRGLVATGFLALGQKALAQQDKKKLLFDMYDEQVDTISKGILGVTLSCARCHDHKFDPLLSRDYYSLVSILAATRNFEDAAPHVSKLLFKPLGTKEDTERYQKAKEALTAKQNEADDFLDQQIDKYIAALVPRSADYMLAAYRVYQDRADPVQISREKNLLPDVLKKWVSFLEPTAEVRPYLKEWSEAAGNGLAVAAQAYQNRIEEGRVQVVAQQQRFRQVRRRRQNMPAGPRREGPDKFFNEVNYRGPLSLSDEERESILTPDARQKLSELRKAAKDQEARMPPEPEMSCSVEDGPETVTLVTGKVLVRGDYNTFGEDAPKGFPLILAGPDQPAITKGSGRLDLANWLTRPDHPLTSRVFVNRVWYWHFGEGLVRTPDNFGKMGETPTHPELLNYLSSKFTESGWSVKALHRMILLSNTYQMSSLAGDPIVQADPENRLFSRFPRRRLSVEEMRDGMLAIDGSLDLAMGGTLQSGFGTDGENSKDRLSVRPESVKRREVYLPLRRANLPNLLNLFDFGDATTAASKRPATTVAPQALFMMNSDFVTGRAQNLAKQLLDNPSLDQAGRARSLYLRILNRQATPLEIDTGLSYIDGFQKRGTSLLEAWTSFSRILLASNEYIYLD